MVRTTIMAWLFGAYFFAAAQEPDFRSSHLAIGFNSTVPAFSWLAVDSLGRAALEENVILGMAPTGGDVVLRRDGGGKFHYVQKGPDGREAVVWRMEISEKRVVLRSDFVEGMVATPFLLAIDQKKNHATLLGIPADAGQIRLPAVLHLPDRGTFRITSADAAIVNCDARRRQPEYFVKASFPPATPERKSVQYDLDVVLIHPDLPGLVEQPLYDGYRRNFLNLLQIHPRMRTLANNSSSDVCGFCFWEYSELALKAPPLAPGLTALDLVRVSMDRVFEGGLTYGQAGYGKTKENPEAAAWSPSFDSLDTLPSFLIASCHYIQGSQDTKWAEARFPRLIEMARKMIAQDKNGNGLIEYPLSGNSGSWKGGIRPANWWDTIGFGHEDAYSNALAYRGLRLMSKVALGLGQKKEAEEFSAAAQKIKEAYFPTFLNPETGLLAGWKSADGKLHDYSFTFVNGMAVSFGLVETKEAGALMDKMLQKMEAVGFRRFDLGLPGNLIPVRKEDYTDPRKRYGGSEKEDGSDGFQIYENGAATHCHAYWTVKALYNLDRPADARKIFHPMLKTFAEGGFQGFGANGQSKDWRDWNGGCNGYEGYLVDGYLALLAVEDDLRAGKP
jgi:hypothetical protein